jgi:hypothetical protein
VTQHKRGLREKDRFLFLMDGDRKGGLTKQKEKHERWGCTKSA